MKRKLLCLTSLIALASMASYGQNTSGGTSSSSSSVSGQTGTLPPGLQNREQLPPGLQNRQQLPPGLERRTNASSGYGRLGSGTLGAGTLGGSNATSSTNAGSFGATVGSGGISQPAVGASGNVTNSFGGSPGSGALSQSSTGSVSSGVSASGTGLATSEGTNRLFGGTFSTNETGLAPTSNQERQNRVYSTNSVDTTNTSVTNYSARMTQMMRDQAITPQDQQLLVQVRRLSSPVLRSTVASTGSDNPWLPVNFVIREKVVTIVGVVPSPEISQRIETRVQEIPGVQQVINQLRIEDEVNSGTAVATTTIRQDQAFTAPDQQLLVQVRRAITPAIRTVSVTQPIHFVVRDNVVTIVGAVPSQEISRQVEARVEQVSGVRQVVNQLRVENTAVGGSSNVESDNANESTSESSATTSAGTTGSVTSGTTSGASTNTFGASTSTTNRFGAGFGTNQTGLLPTSDRTNASSRTYSSTNQSTVNTNLSPTSRPESSERQYQNLPPGLQKRDELPPGLQKREELPPGLQKRQDQGTQGTNG